MIYSHIVRKSYTAILLSPSQYQDRGRKSPSATLGCIRLLKALTEDIREKLYRRGIFGRWVSCVKDAATPSLVGNGSRVVGFKIRIDMLHGTVAMGDRGERCAIALIIIIIQSQDS